MEPKPLIAGYYQKLDSLNDNSHLLSIDTNKFAQEIKAQYPEYRDIDNKDLVKRVIEKYPEYANLSFKESRLNESLRTSETEQLTRRGDVDTKFDPYSSSMSYWLVPIIVVIIICARWSRKENAVSGSPGSILSSIKRRSPIIRYLVIAALLILVCTNPSRSEFASYMHWKGDKYIGRENNYFLCSVYSLRAPARSERYFAIFGNFYRIR